MLSILIGNQPPDKACYAHISAPHPHHDQLLNMRQASPSKSLLFDLLADELIDDPNKRKLVRDSFPQSSVEDIYNLHDLIWENQKIGDWRSNAIQHALTLYILHEQPENDSFDHAWGIEFSRYLGSKMLPPFFEAQVQLLISLDFEMNNLISFYCFEIASWSKNDLRINSRSIFSEIMTSLAIERLQSQGLFSQLYDLSLCLAITLEPCQRLQVLCAVNDIPTAIKHAVVQGGRTLCMLAEFLVLQKDKMIYAVELGIALMKNKENIELDICADSAETSIDLLYRHMCARMRNVPQMCDFLFIVCLETNEYARVLRLYDLFEAGCNVMDENSLNPTNLEGMREAVAFLPPRSRLTPQQRDRLEVLEAEGDPTQEKPVYEINMKIFASEISEKTKNQPKESTKAKIKNRVKTLDPFAASRIVMARTKAERIAEDENLEQRMRLVKLAGKENSKESSDHELSVDTSDTYEFENRENRRRTRNSGPGMELEISENESDGNKMVNKKPRLAVPSLPSERRRKSRKSAQLAQKNLKKSSSEIIQNKTGESEKYENEVSGSTSKVKRKRKSSRSSSRGNLKSPKVWEDDEENSDSSDDDKSETSLNQNVSTFNVGGLSHRVTVTRRSKRLQELHAATEKNI